LHNCIIGADSKLHYCVVDKNVQIATQCQLGHSDAGASHLCLIGKQSIIPAKMKIGKFCKVYPLTDLGQYSTRTIEDFQEVGESLL
jgi:UDP-3-O-[3-hydroxymyristoyl] glucosamine N-acyltransferase